ncbi:MAG: SDR family oxidoreductase [bacterium]|nr:SDR family oxidoreductase [bacterium]
MTERATALILGAGKGLGAAIAEECQQRGLRTIEVARFRGGEPAVGEPERERRFEVVGRSPRVTDDRRATITYDLATGPGTLITALNDLRSQDWHTTHFFWVAGIWWEGPFEIMELDQLTRMLDVNIRNAVIICQYVWSEFVRSSEPRRFVTIASTAGLDAKRDQAIYVATKWAQVGFTRALALEAAELRRRGRIPGEHYIPDIRVRLLEPGGMRTHLFDAARPPNYSEFMDPAKVAAHIVDTTIAQAAPFVEEMIPRNSALGRSLR